MKVEIKINEEQKVLVKEIAKTFKISKEKALKIMIQNLIDRYFNESYISTEDLENEIYK